MGRRTQPILWHQQCLENQKAYLARELYSLKRMQMFVERLKAEADFYELQIETAIAQGKTAFDCDRFMIKRPKKEAGT